MKPEIQELVESAKEAARLGGSILEDWGSRFTAREKRPSDLVTEADLASQQAIFDLLHARYPEHNFLGEEGLNWTEGNSTYRWIIDPLDGTSNYVHRFPYYAVSIGLEDDGELVAGVIYDPTRDEMFAAGRGLGATLNDQPIHVSQYSHLMQAMCMASLPVRATREHPAVSHFLNVMERAQTVQRTGSAALNLCAVACGRIEAFWSASLNPWDTAAGVLLVREAGGKVTLLNGDDYSVHQPQILATNGNELHAELTQIFGEV